MGAVVMGWGKECDRVARRAGNATSEGMDAVEPAGGGDSFVAELSRTRHSNTRAHSGSLVQNRAFPERTRQNVVERVAPVVYIVERVGEDVGGHTEPRDRAIQPVQHLVATPAGPEQDYLLGVSALKTAK